MVFVAREHIICLGDAEYVRSGLCWFSCHLTAERERDRITMQWSIVKCCRVLVSGSPPPALARG
jgi:hypothetical protein